MPDSSRAGDHDQRCAPIMPGRSLLKDLVNNIDADILACNLLLLCCAWPASLLGFFYIFEPGLLLRICWFFTLGDIRPVFRLKHISLNMSGLGSQGFNQTFGVIGVWDNCIAFNVGIIFADQPRLRIPRAAAPFTSKAQNMDLFTYILVTKRDEFILWSHNNTEIVAFAFCSWFGSFFFLQAELTHLSGVM